MRLKCLEAAAEATQLSSEIMGLVPASRERLSATSGYAELVASRIIELSEQHVDGHQRLRTFIDRHFRRALRTCAATDERLHRLATSVARAGDLLLFSLQSRLKSRMLLSCVQ